MEVNVHEAKTHLSRLLEHVRFGEEVVIAKAGRPVAKLVRYEAPRAGRVLGSAVGQIGFAPGWDEPWTAAELEEFLGP